MLPIRAPTPVRWAHITAGLDERQRRDHEEDRELWRDTQRQIQEMDKRLVERIEDLARESKAADARLGKRLDDLAAESRAADARLGERIGDLVSGIGRFLAGKQ
jgi:hypothetical protein